MGWDIPKINDMAVLYLQLGPVLMTDNCKILGMGMIPCFQTGWKWRL